MLAARFAAPGSSGVRELLQHVQAAAAAAEAADQAANHSAVGALQGEGLAAALASVPERAAALELQQLEPDAFVPAVVGQLLDLLAEHQQPQQQPQAHQPPLEQQQQQASEAHAAGAAFVGDVVGRFCRRGHQQQVAAALLQRLLPHAPQRQSAAAAATPAAEVACSVVAAVPDSTALGKLLEAVLKAAAALAAAAPEPGVAPLSLDASPEADPGAQAVAATLSSLVPPAVWKRRVDARLALTDKLLVQQQRQLLPLSALRGLLLFLQRQLQTPGTSGGSSGGSSGGTSGGSLLADVAAHVAQLWGDASAVQRLAAQQQAYLTAALCGCLALMGRQQLDGHPQLLQLLLGGITNRLGSPLQSVRRQGMRVGQAMSAQLDPAKPPMFSEEEEQLHQLLPEERWETQMQASAAATAVAAAPGPSAAPGRKEAAGVASTPRQQHREERQRRRQEAATRHEARQRRRQQRGAEAEDEAEGPLTETDSDDNASASDASSLSSSGSDSCGSSSSGEFEQYDVEESDEEDPTRSRLQVRGCSTIAQNHMQPVLGKADATHPAPYTLTNIHTWPLSYSAAAGPTQDAAGQGGG